MADKNISTLPAVESIDNDSLFVAEQQGVASKVTGAQVASFAEKAANANVQAAVDAAKKAQEAAETAEAAAQVTAHPPQVNEETGFWQVWNSGTGAYEDTTIQAEGPVGPQGTSVKSITAPAVPERREPQTSTRCTIRTMKRLEHLPYTMARTASAPATC